jgi:hypothetical protein
MTTPDTRPAITEEQLQRLVQSIERMRSEGNVSLTDPRVSQVQTWILGLVGMGLIAAGCWVAQSISTLSSTVAASVQRLDQYGTTLEDHEQRLRDQERKP